MFPELLLGGYIADIPLSDFGRNNFNDPVGDYFWSRRLIWFLNVRSVEKHKKSLCVDVISLHQPRLILQCFKFVEGSVLRVNDETFLLLFRISHLGNSPGLQQGFVCDCRRSMRENSAFLHVTSSFGALASTTSGTLESGLEAQPMIYCYAKTSKETIRKIHIFRCSKVNHIVTNLWEKN